MEKGEERMEKNFTPTQYFTFFIATDEYAIEILRVREIITYDFLTRVPKTPLWIKGVINLRGRVVPVIDLALKFGLAESKPTKWTCIVIVENYYEQEQTLLGIMVDYVNQVVDFSSDDIENVPDFGVKIKLNYLLGMGKVGKKFVLILDIVKILSEEELVIINQLPDSKTFIEPVEEIQENQEVENQQENNHNNN
ncbi:MAG: chemotaxis protein CheW [Acidobacteria bacterium]|nr:chemotaxis protein CheW [Acidobacteriota bacterium]